MVLFFNFIASLKAANNARKPFIRVRINKLILQVLEILVNEGYVFSFRKNSPYTVVIYLKYIANRSVFHDIKLISSISHPTHLSHRRLLKLRYPLVVVSTSKGLITWEKAMEEKIGGLILFALW